MATRIFWKRVLVWNVRTDKKYMLEMKHVALESNFLDLADWTDFIIMFGDVQVLFSNSDYSFEENVQLTI